MLKIILIKIVTSERVLITTLEENSAPVFEVYDPNNDKVKVVEKVLGVGRSGLVQNEGEGRIVENNLLVQYRLDTGEAWLVSRKPEEIEGAANVQFGDSICSVGGYNRTSGAAPGDVTCWNPFGKSQEQEWVKVSEMMTPRFMPGSVVMDGKLFVAGGYDPKTHKFLNSVEVFDDVTKKWYSLPPLKHARAGLGLAGVGGTLFAIGENQNCKKICKKIAKNLPLVRIRI